MAALEVLRRKADFDEIGRRGAARANRLLVVRSLRNGRQESRVGLSTPRTLGGAVQRNRVRRRLRELVREQLKQGGAGWDLLIIARPEASRATYTELREALVSLLQRSEVR